MGFDQARIVLDSPIPNTYYAGQTVNGRLIFSTDKVKKFRGIYVRMRGYCKVHWTTQERRRSGDRVHHRTINHDSYEDYFDQKVYLSGSSSGDHKLPPGEHEFPFSIHIPDNCPSPVEGEYGHVRYELKVVVDRPLKFDQELTAPIKIISPLDLNMVPIARETIQMKLEDTYCCWCISSGSSETLVKLPRTGYCPGELIPVEVCCINRSTEEIEIKLALKKEVTFHATSAPGTKHEKSTLLEEKRGPVPPHVTRGWTVKLVVPDVELHNLRTCSFIDVEYELKVTVSPDGCHDDSDESCNLIFGTIPLGATQPLQNPQIVVPTQNYPQAVTQQPFPNSYPGYPPSQPYPNQNSPYPGNSPYPARSTSPFPPNPYPPSPYPPGPPQGGENPPFPNPQSPYPVPPQGAEKPPYPNPQSPYPVPPQGAEKPPYPNPQSPYPVPLQGAENPQYSNPQSPYPVPPQGAENPPYPITPPGSQYPNTPNRTSPYLRDPLPQPYQPSPTTGLKTGTFGFIHGADKSEHGVSIPLLPPGSAVPMPKPIPADPYAPSAPEPSTPDIDATKPLMSDGKGDESQPPPFNPNV